MRMEEHQHPATRGETAAPQSGGMAGGHGHMALWVQPILLLLGVWLLASPPALAYRSAALTASDLASGVLVILIAAYALLRGGAWTGYAQALVGVWLISAPLLFWAPTPAGYLNDTLLGVLVIAFALLFPHSMPMPGPDKPAGWSYNPSTWLQRAPMIALGFIGFFLGRYMTAFQLGHIATAWDPFFGNGTVRVLQSKVAAFFPVSDAGLGAWVYLLEALMGLMGDRRRWRTMPWMVTFFGLLVVPLGIVSIVLVILQPLVVGTWCTICLVAALTTLIMIPLTLDEVVAMARFLVQRHRAGASVWRVFWRGDDDPNGAEDRRAPGFGAPAAAMAPAMVWGMGLPWRLLLSAALGLWLMAAPALLRVGGAAAHSDHLVGALVVTFSLIALAEVGRAARFVILPLAAWTVIAPWLLGGAGAAAIASNAIVGVALFLLALPRGPIRERYGEWERYIT